MFLQPRENPPDVGIRAARATSGPASTSRRVIDMAKRFYYDEGGDTGRMKDRRSRVTRIPPAADPDQRETAEALAALVAKGAVTLGTGRLRRIVKPATLKPGKSIAEMISKDRR